MTQLPRPTTTWKAFERLVAERLGGQRIPASGNGAIKGDVLHEHYLIECKYGNQVPKTVLDWWAEAQRDALTEARNRGVQLGSLTPLIVMRRPSGVPVVVIALDDFVPLVERAYGPEPSVTVGAVTPSHEVID